jgi:predicted ribosome quality control (RQC) complex YloA/Tae2 family protein
MAREPIAPEPHTADAAPFVVERLPSDLVPAKVQKARVADDVCTLEVFAGRKRFVVVAPGRVDVVDARPTTADGDGAAGADGADGADGAREPPALQGLVRKELVPAILSAIDVDDAAGLLRLRFARKDTPARVLLVEHDARAPRWLLLAATDDGERILAGAPATRADDGRDLRRGRLYEPPRRTPQRATTRTTTSGTTKSMATIPPALRTARARLKAEVDRLARLDKALAGDERKHGDAARLQEDGELLKTVLGTLRRGAASVDVTGFDGAARTIALDVTKDARDNLTALFSKAKKARAALAHAAPRRADVQARLAALAPLRTRANAADADVDIDALVASIDAALSTNTTSTAPSARRVAARQGKRLPWRAFRIPQDTGGDVVVRVGRGARDNDALVKAARGNDLWLHARDTVGAHVVVPSSGGPVADALVRDGALLAAHFSARRGERHVDVQHTRVKHLKKPGPGAPAGLFLVGHESVLHLRIDDDRVAALLRCEVPAT